jgi:hypothetical protein
VVKPTFLVLAITIVQAGLYKDLNFETQLAMERAISDNDWDKVLELARKPNKNPNRLMVIYRNIALYNKNQLCEKMFMFPNSDEPFHTKNLGKQHHYWGACHLFLLWSAELFVSLEYGEYGFVWPPCGESQV